MKRISVCIAILLTMVCCASLKAQEDDTNVSKYKRILVMVAGDQLMRDDLRVFFAEEGYTNEIFNLPQQCGRSEGWEKSKFIRVKNETVEIGVESGGLAYIFEIRARDGMMCGLFKNAETGIVISTDMDAESFMDTTDQRKDVTMLLTGDIWEKRIGFSVDSELLFDDVLRGTVTPFTKRFTFPIDEQVFNAGIVVDGIKYSLDFDTSEGCFIILHKTERQFLIRQYASEKEFPGLL